MDEIVRRWISEILEQYKPLLSIAIRQRAKFEGWLINGLKIEQT